MSERMPAEIWIGGKFTRDLLLEMPYIEDMSPDFDETPLDLTSNETIMQDCHDGYLHFADAEATWGQFTELEEWLRVNDKPFERQTDGKYEYAPEFVWFRPDCAPLLREGTWETLPEGACVITASAVAKIVKQMGKLVTARKPNDVLLKKWYTLYRKLLKLLPPELPTLPKFKIVD